MPEPENPRALVFLEIVLAAALAIAAVGAGRWLARVLHLGWAHS